MQGGMTKEQGSYNKPLDVVHPEALAAGTLIQYKPFDEALETSPTTALESGKSGLSVRIHYRMNHYICLAKII